MQGVKLGVVGFGADRERRSVEEVGGEMRGAADAGAGSRQRGETPIGGLAVAEQEDGAVTKIEERGEQHRTMCG